MLKEVKFQKQKVVNKSHVANLINRKDQHKSQKELPKRESASEAIPDCDHTYTDNHQETDDKKCPSDRSGSVEELFISLYQHFSRFLGSRGEKFIILNKRHG
jgi:hypothetical protein